MGASDTGSNDNLEGWICEVAQTIDVAQITESKERDVIYALNDRRFPDSKRPSKLITIRDFAVNKSTWIHTLQRRYPQVKDTVQMLYHRTCHK